MKPATNTKSTTTNHQPLCATKQKQSFWHYWWQQVSPSPLASRANTRALQDTLAGLGAAMQEVLSNNRYTAGIVFLLIIAPLSSVFYYLFNPAVFIENWYYTAPYYLWYTLSPYLMLGFASVGIFLLFPQKCKTSYLATVWPLGYAIAKITYLSLFVTTNEQFHAAAPWFLLLTGVLIAISLLLTTNYLLYRKYHLKHGTIARIMGIIQAPGIDADTKMKLLENQRLELENFF